MDLQRLSDRKIASAQILARAHHWANAYYLAGYAIELGLKAVAAKMFVANSIPEKSLVNKIYTHDFRDLVGLVGLKSEIDKRISSDSVFAANWAICSEWSPDCRYQEKSATETTFLLAAATESKSGVLPWIKTFW